MNLYFFDSDTLILIFHIYWNLVFFIEYIDLPFFVLFLNFDAFTRQFSIYWYGIIHWNFVYMALVILFLEKGYSRTELQSLSHSNLNCLSQNGPRIMVCGMPVWYDHKNTGKAKKFHLYSFFTSKIMKTAKWQMLPA